MWENPNEFNDDEPPTDGSAPYGDEGEEDDIYKNYYFSPNNTYDPYYKNELDPASPQFIVQLPFDITESVKNAVDFEDNDSYHGFAFITSSGTVYLFNEDYSTGSYRPLVEIYYRNMVGLESYWDYDQYSIGNNDIFINTYNDEATVGHRFSLYTKYKNHEITHQEWCDETARLFMERGLTKDQVFQIGEKTEMLPGCKELFEELQKHEVKIFIYSGSIDTMISAAIPNDIEKMIKHISSNIFLYDNNGNLNSIKGTLYDFEGKKDFIEDIVMKKYHFVSSEIAFVGNSDNDIWAYLSRVRTILINPNNVEPGDRKIWDYCLPEVNNLLELKPYLLPMQ